ncbi:E3 ubiquitin-protein ligase ATL41-like [Aristolochia californica]|uniref:E3 ubiquitin-protein ligase ATL41-like n=1 Tax=Aristolochia californica TaxID=171875 RepID=UPI0035DF38F6
MTSLFMPILLIILAAICRIIEFMLLRKADALEAGLEELPANGDDSTEDHRRALDHSMIASLPFFLYNPKDEELWKEAECSICLIEMKENDKARKLPLCQHWYHAACIDEWLLKDASCPMCRAAVWQEV